MKVVLFCTLVGVAMLLPSARSDSSDTSCSCELPPFLSGDVFSVKDEYFGNFHFDLEKKIYAFDLWNFPASIGVHYLTIYGPEKNNVADRTTSNLYCSPNSKLPNPLAWSVQRCVPEYECQTHMFRSRKIRLDDVTYEVKFDVNGTCTPERLTIHDKWAPKVLTNIIAPNTSQIQGLKSYFTGCKDVDYLFGKP